MGKIDDMRRQYDAESRARKIAWHIASRRALAGEPDEEKDTEPSEEEKREIKDAIQKLGDARWRRECRATRSRKRKRG